MKIADISHYQGTINWDKAREELDFVIFRASVGKAKDTKYVSNAQKCGVPFGAYHYCKAGSKAQAKTEAQYFYKAATVKGIKPLFFVADIEYATQTASNVKGITQAFADELRALGAEKLGLYIGQELYPKSAKAAYDFIWIPRYGKNDGTANEKYKPIYACDLWQYTSKGKVAGISGNVDLNILRSDKTVEWFTKNAAPLNLGDRVLKKGCIGNDVFKLQQALNKVFKAALEEDGEFGSNTFKAVKKLQIVSNLEVTGIYDAAAHEALMNKLNNPDGLVTCHADYIYSSDSINSTPFTTIEANQIVVPVLDTKGVPIISSNGFYAVRVENKIGWLNKINIAG